jgi:hypothetical protein
MLKSIGLGLSLMFMLTACNGNTAELKTVQQQEAGGYTITVLSETGTIKNGTSDFILEFRKTGEDALVDVGTVEVSPIMEMAGMAPMMGTTNITPAETKGRYRVSCTLTMAGMWRLNLKFGAGEEARININAQ